MSNQGQQKSSGSSFLASPAGQGSRAVPVSSSPIEPLTAAMLGVERGLADAASGSKAVAEAMVKQSSSFDRQSKSIDQLRADLGRELGAVAKATSDLAKAVTEEHIAGSLSSQALVDKAETLAKQGDALAQRSKDLEAGIKRVDETGQHLTHALQAIQPQGQTPMQALQEFAWPLAMRHGPAVVTHVVRILVGSTTLAALAKLVYFYCTHAISAL